jgi:hypothetical protein
MGEEKLIGGSDILLQKWVDIMNNKEKRLLTRLQKIKDIFKSLDKKEEVW